ncbi:MAG: type II toxin-antitoxin system mRNA interferase toxin, RelE/StbE family [Deltaproteobacteria bacterium CG_4_8_14_3_um_filter_43_13]|nr:MAG: type II toxin-antitoxin system mRNA interferase toxin, RelE/StbE family [Deltaproteobacteria bacterium CG06_land_8_20_14_3_00_44_19]PIX26482.1 MAG: type II toxin-antitoxin system mRNA interferase toxin, RelE/StbE family [Deltaproteobacteria bacterium CG_4_8_14_3_um_filter_43_13]PIZ21162.1 MAG: type II toxin-antitoxin system mRNA interferase toxin, RelE/StbE family [Deltaproteobacteria bacterium CG_4_10_14_0_8_um_filter_43_12]
MRTLIWSNTFIRAFKRVLQKQPNLRKDIEDTLKLLAQDPFTPQLETHKLKGKLSGSWACSAGYDLRIVFDFVKSEKQKKDDIFLIEIGTHDEVY